MSLAPGGRRTLLVGVVALTLAASACGGGGGNKKPSASASSTTAASSGNGSGDGSPGTTGEQGSSLTTVSTTTPATKTSSTVPMNRFGAPEAGTYTYTTTLQRGTKEPEHGNTFVRIDDDSGNSQFFVQIVSYVVGGDTKRWAYVWDPSGRRVKYEQEQTGGGTTDLCEWNPTYRDIPVPLTDSSRWTAHATCPVSGTTRTRDLTVDVTGRETVDIGGVKVNALKLHWVEDTSTPIGNQTLGTHIDRTDWYDPTRNLVVKTKGKETKSLAGVPKAFTTTDATLQSVNPH